MEPELKLDTRKKPPAGFTLLLERTFSDAGVPSQHRALTKKAARELLLTFLENVQEDLTRYGGGRVSIPGFGVFTLRTRKERRVLNPRTKESMVLPATKTVGFRPAKELRKALGSIQ